MRAFHLFTLLVLFGCFTSTAQAQQDLLFRVIDKASQQAVPYATIQFANNKQGTVSNVLGDF
ncbi:peptidase associated/transthyretin-like domain-containing protein [Winogradskyella bathintestinalis]|uniref:Carboxypeptidase regulatory-like domain-containing protein n=1 Tax=Winogradskyella bathintestinalis TaxID=3035208 RepID=A0ABT7ZWT4_9FLAO|nr:hypothetical protein [Winogradskyella bathintestinalis]MDN3493470.1 hypothetical protein [Winogradskyella bathintestinalis]